MVTYGKLKYGGKLWESTINNVARKPYLLVPFYQGLKKAGAGSKVLLYNNTFDSLKALWNNDNRVINKTNRLKYLSNLCGPYTNYLYPRYVRGKIFAVKTGINDITRFVFLDSISESIICTPGRYNNTRVSVGNNYIAWEEVQPDIRWQQVSYSIIKLYNYNTGHLSTLDRKTRLFSPALSPGEDSVLAVRENENYRSSLIICRISDQKEVWSKEFPLETLISYPVWIDRKTIGFIQTDTSGKSIHLLDIQNYVDRNIFNCGFENITNLSAKDGYIYFSYDKELARNIYRLNLSTLIVKRLTNSEYGADFANPDPVQNKLLFSDYTANGYRIAELPLRKNMGINDSLITEYHYAWADTLSRRAGFNIQTTQIRNIQYDSSRYRRLSHALYLHSWTPFYFDMGLPVFIQVLHYCHRIN